MKHTLNEAFLFKNKKCVPCMYDEVRTTSEQKTCKSIKIKILIAKSILPEYDIKTSMYMGFIYAESKVNKHIFLNKTLNETFSEMCFW